MNVELRPIASLRPNPRNPRTHSKRQIRQIADSIRAFGFTNPVLIDDADIDHRRPRPSRGGQAAGQENVPTIRLSAMTEAQKRAYVIADNKLALNAGWDEQLLALELQYLSELELDFDLGVIGFETAEIDLLLSGLADVEADAIDADSGGGSRRATRSAGPAISGTVAGTGCSAAMPPKPDAFATLMAGEQAQMVFTDPPYNVPIDGHVCGLGKVQAPRVRDGRRRDELGGIHRLPQRGARPSGGP